MEARLRSRSKYKSPPTNAQDNNDIGRLVLETEGEMTYTITRSRFRSRDCFNAHVKIILIINQKMIWNLDLNLDLDLEAHPIDP